MYQSPKYVLQLGVVLGLMTALTGCSTLSRTGDEIARMANAVTPYQVEVVQGNAISREQVEALHPGMSKEQVRGILGTPLVASPFHPDRWDYVFTVRRRGLDMEKHLTVFFSNNALERVEGGDTMPSASEFVSMLDTTKGKPRIPQLEATPAQLKRYESKAKKEIAEEKTQEKEEAEEAPKPAGHYPPLNQ